MGSMPVWVQTTEKINAHEILGQNSMPLLEGFPYSGQIALGKATTYQTIIISFLHFIQRIDSTSFPCQRSHVLTPGPSKMLNKRHRHQIMNFLCFGQRKTGACFPCCGNPVSMPRSNNLKLQHYEESNLYCFLT